MSRTTSFEKTWELRNANSVIAERKRLSRCGTDLNGYPAPRRDAALAAPIYYVGSPGCNDTTAETLYIHQPADNARLSSANVNGVGVGPTIASLFPHSFSVSDDGSA